MGGLEAGIIALIVFALLLPVGFMTVIILRLRVLLQKQSDQRPDDSAIHILRERFARGEISEDECLRRKCILESDDPCYDSSSESDSSGNRQQ